MPTISINGEHPWTGMSAAEGFADRDINSFFTANGDLVDPDGEDSAFEFSMCQLDALITAQEYREEPRHYNCSGLGGGEDKVRIDDGSRPCTWCRRSVEPGCGIPVIAGKVACGAACPRRPSIDAWRRQHLSTYRKIADRRRPHRPSRKIDCDYCGTEFRLGEGWPHMWFRCQSCAPF